MNKEMKMIVRGTVKRLLEKYEILIEVDPKHPGLVAPDSFKNGDNHILRIGYDTEVSANLQVTEKHFSADMPFTAGVVSYCEVPWDAIVRLSPSRQRIIKKERSHLSIVKKEK